MATKLKNMKITKVALCEEGCCSEAHIHLFKRKEKTPMNFEEILKSLPEDQQKVIQDEMEAAKACGKQEMQKEVDDAKEEAAKAQKEADAAKKELAQSKGNKEPSEEELLKSASPAVRALIEKQRAQIAAAEAVAKAKLEEEATNLAKSRAAVLKSVPGEEDAKTELFKSLHGKDAKLAEQVYDILSKANAAIEASAAMNPAGSNNPGATAGDADSAWSEIEKAADTIVKSKNVTKEAAISEVMKTQPELYQNYLKSLE